MLLFYVLLIDIFNCHSEFLKFFSINAYAVQLTSLLS